MSHGQRRQNMYQAIGNRFKDIFEEIKAPVDFTESNDALWLKLKQWLMINTKPPVTTSQHPEKMTIPTMWFFICDILILLMYVLLLVEYGLGMVFSTGCGMHIVDLIIKPSFSIHPKTNFVLVPLAVYPPCNAYTCNGLLKS